ncbi:MAG: hypothetical protein Q7S57_03855 [bacterium]|nr:hypothetical protein [bacterium]
MPNETPQDVNAGQPVSSQNFEKLPTMKDFDLTDGQKWELKRLQQVHEMGINPETVLGEPREFTACLT